MQYSVEPWMQGGKNIGWRVVGKTHDVIQYYRGFRRKILDPFGPKHGGMYDADCFQDAHQLMYALCGGINNWMNMR